MDLDDPAALASPLRDPTDLDPLLDRIGDARYVLLGEASHGTHDYYWWREQLTRRLIAERGFSIVAVEGDWPDCRAVHRSVTLAPGAPEDPGEVLDGFGRWPTWMWANHEVTDFARWLRGYNTERAPGERVGFHGLDVYSLWDSMRAVLDYLAEHEPEHVEAAREAWRCFEPYAEDPHRYAYATRLVPTSCEDTVIGLLERLCSDVPPSADGDDPDARFDAEQNAAVAAGAERYYRQMVLGGGGSWNVRDQHMTDTLDRLMAHGGPRAKAVVWEHNTHIGDARATDMAAAGMVNVGQLVRERHAGEGVVIVGFGGWEGSVIAAESWGAPMQRMPVPPARQDSVEDRLHRAGLDRSLLVFPAEPAQPRWLRDVAPHRAIGVVYRPERERFGNYVPTVLGRRYDAFCYFDATSALQPLHLAERQSGLEEETYPFGE